MGRPPVENKQRQFAVALPPEYRSQLETAAAAAGHSLAEEIRTHLGWRLDLNPVDEPTLELLTAVARMAAGVERETGAAWHAHAGSHIAFRQAILSYLTDPDLKPEGTITFGARPHQADPSDNPEEIGLGIQQWVRHTIGWSREEREGSRLFREKNLRELFEFHQLHQKRDKQEGGNG